MSIVYPKTASVLLFVFLAACGAGEPRDMRSQVDRGATAAMPVADDVRSAGIELSQETVRAIEAFRATVDGLPPERLTGGASSRDALVRQFVAAVESADTAALIAMTMDRGEFIALHYPYSIYARPPYELSPNDIWLLSRAETEKGLTRLLQRFGGRPFGFLEYACPDPPRREGPNRWWSGCTITRSVAGVTHTMRYFASIWERDGEFGFGGYANDL